jgi:hypothetical protein
MMNLATHLKLDVALTGDLCSLWDMGVGHVCFCVCGGHETYVIRPSQFLLHLDAKLPLIFILHVRQTRQIYKFQFPSHTSRYFSLPLFKTIPAHHTTKLHYHHHATENAQIDNAA